MHTTEALQITKGDRLLIDGHPTIVDHAVTDLDLHLVCIYHHRPDGTLNGSATVHNWDDPIPRP